MASRQAAFSRRSGGIVREFAGRLIAGLPPVVQKAAKTIVSGRFCFGCGSSAHLLSTCPVVTLDGERGHAESCAFRAFSMKSS